MTTPEVCDSAFNLFRDKADAFAALFHDPEPGDRYTVLTRRIVALLTDGHGYPIDHPDHPIQKFGIPDHDDNLTRLVLQLNDDFQGSPIRHLILAFFHSSGLYREEMDDLMEAFDLYARTCLGIEDEDEDENENENE